jgi:uncharacterized membrane protein YdjX (TVP38/TMEM64 family)
VSRRIPVLAPVVLGLALGAALLGSRRATTLLPAFAAWVQGLGPSGMAAYVAGYAVATVALVPGSLLTIAAGVIFGLVRGTALAFLAATLGASAAFLLGRYVARGAVQARLASTPRFAAIGAEGRRIVFLLRLSPLVPFNLLNYALGLSRVRYRDYLLASTGMLPGTLLYVYYGKLAGDLAAVAAGSARRDAGYYLLLAVGLAATVGVTLLLTRLARRALQEVSDAHAD